MAKVINQESIEKYTILTLDERIIDIKPSGRYVVIDKQKYKAEIVYGQAYTIGIIGRGNFIDKEIKFVNE